MKSNSININANKTNTLIKIISFIIFTIIIFWSIFLVRDKLLKNTNDMGVYLAQSYAWEEENRIRTYSSFLSMCAEYTNDKIDVGASDDEISSLLKDYAQKAGITMQYQIIDPYAVINGHIVAAKPWEGDESYGYQYTDWYKNAIEAEGKIIYTNAYQDAITGKSVITLAVKLHGDNNVLAFDIILTNFHIHANRSFMPEQSTYILYGADDELIYCTGSLNSDKKGFDEYTSEIVKQIRLGNMEEHDATVVDLDGKRRGVYYYEMSNGWLSVITIPISQILRDGWNDIIVGLSMIFVLIVGGVIIIMMRSYIMNQKVRYAQDTLQFLGDSYYEIYRVNYKTGFYKPVKTPDDMVYSQETLENYRHLMDNIKLKIENTNADQIEHDFSIENIRKLIANGVFEFQREYRRKFGNRYKWISAQMIYKQALQINEVIICFKDIDEQKKYEIGQNILLKNALETTEKSSKQKTLFFSCASHDLRTPLNAIIGYTRLAHDKKNDKDKLDEYLFKIQTSSERMLNLVNNMLDMARMDYGHKSLNYAPMNLASCIKDSVDMFIEDATEQRKSLSVSYDMPHKYVYGDVIRLSQIMNNLISNAIKYTDKNASILVSVNEMDFNGDNAKYCFVVQDNGRGMSEETKNNLFQPFSKARVGDDGSFNNDLGMPIVRMLVKQMEGDIFVESKLGQGSKVTVIIPMQITDGVFENECNSENIDNLKNIRGRQVILVEENYVDATAIADKLEMIGLNVLYAENGDMAFRIYMENYSDIDIVMLNLKIPVIDGFALADKIRRSSVKNSENVPIIAITESIYDDDMARMAESGINTYLQKPINDTQMQQVIFNYLNRNNNSTQI